MTQSDTTRPGEADTPQGIRPFDGAVQVRFLDTMLASTDRAWVIDDASAGPLYLVPFDDIYFDYLSRTGETRPHPERGVLGLWRVSAAGRAEDDVMWSLDEPPPALRELARHAIFDPAKVAVEEVPADPRPLPYKP